MIELHGHAIVQPGQQLGDISDPDRKVEVLEWSNGWKTITFVELPDEPLPEEVIPGVPTLKYPELLASARDGLDVPAAAVLPLLEEYRAVCQHLAKRIDIPLGSPMWQAEMARLYNLIFNISEEERA